MGPLVKKPRTRINSSTHRGIYIFIIPKVDLLYFFNGAGTHEPIMAIFSGPDIPPELTTWDNQVLVWFVTDGANQGKGWKAEYRFQDRD